MKKVMLLVCLLFVAAFVFGSQAQAGTYYFLPSDSDMDDLEHAYFYGWGINFDLQEDESIVSAQIKIYNLYNWDDDDTTNILYMDLVEEIPEGFYKAYDNSSGDAVAAYANGAGIDYTALTTYHDPDGPDTIESLWSYNFSSAQLLALNEYVDDGNFGLGFDPDCHFYNKKVKLVLTTEKNAVPEPATIMLMASGLVGGFGLKRRRKLA